MREAKKERQESRKGRKGLTLWIKPEVHHALRTEALRLQKTLQAFVEELIGITGDGWTPEAPTETPTRKLEPEPQSASQLNALTRRIAELEAQNGKLQERAKSPSKMADDALGELAEEATSVLAHRGLLWVNGEADESLGYLGAAYWAPKPSPNEYPCLYIVKRRDEEGGVAKRIAQEAMQKQRTSEYVQELEAQNADLRARVDELEAARPAVPEPKVPQRDPSKVLVEGNTMRRLLAAMNTLHLTNAKAILDKLGQDDLDEDELRAFLIALTNAQSSVDRILKGKNLADVDPTSGNDTSVLDLVNTQKRQLWLKDGEIEFWKSKFPGKITQRLKKEAQKAAEEHWYTCYLDGQKAAQPLPEEA